MNSNWQYINIYKHMVDNNGNPVKEYLDNDGLHLSPAGYEIWKQVVLSTLPSQQ